MGAFTNSFSRGFGVQQGANKNVQLRLDATGTGGGIATLRMRVSENMTVTLNNNGRFYTDSGATLGESQEWLITSGATRTIYVKVTSGFSILNIPIAASVIKIGEEGVGNGWVSSTNAPSLGDSITKLKNLTNIWIDGNTTISGDITAFTNLTYTNIKGSNTLSGNVSGLTLLTQLYVLGNNTLTGSIAGLTQLGYVYVTGNNTISYPNVTNLTKLGNLILNQYDTLSESNINQILADFWANRNVAKGTAQRVIDLRGSTLNAAPTGQGLIDADALRAYRSPTPPGTASLWTVSVRQSNTGMFFGDSITVGYNVSAANRFTTLLSAAHSPVLTEYNFGQTGRWLMSHPTTPTGQSMYENISTIPTRPNHGKFLLFEFGANDCAGSTDTTRFYNQYCEIIDYAISKGWSASQIKLLTCQRIGSPYADFNTAINNVGTAKNVQVIDTATQLLADPATYLLDTVHPSNAGHLLMSNYINSVLT